MTQQKKRDIKALIALNEEQKAAKEVILNSPITLVTGRAGTGKSLLCANIAINMLLKKQIDSVYIVRATIEVGKTLGFLPGDLKTKYDPYIEAFIENLYASCDKKEMVDKLIEESKIQMLPLQFIRGKTVNSLLIVEETQNCTKKEVEAIVTRLGKQGKIILNGDSAQKDIREDYGGIDLCYELAKYIEGFEHVKLKENQRHGIVGDILNYIYK